MQRSPLKDDSGPVHASHGRGTNQTGVRLYNERLILSLIRRHGRLTKVDIARLTGLSLQTTTVVMNRLEADGLLLAGERQRGRIGQPAVPYSLNPDGAYGLGMVVGRRACELVLMDFVAGVRRRERLTYPYPLPDQLIAFAGRTLPDLIATLSPAAQARICGTGIATPFELWNWEEVLEAPKDALAGWHDFDLGAELSRIAPGPVRVINDATAACAAELTFGGGSAYRDFAYFYIATFIGGGIVLNGSLFPGRSGNAGAFGSMPVVARGPGGGAGVQQLIRSASLYRLERQLGAIGIAGSQLWEHPDDWSHFSAPVDAWIEEAAEGLAQAIASCLAVVDFEAMVIDGAFPAPVRDKLVKRTAAAFARLDRQGLTETRIVAGTMGRAARAIGGAALPLLDTFGRDLDVLFKD
ncbi:ROK family transcriptional regulator [Xanthobacter sp. DSM 14520]|uniref:ROK family transcriptional regulator n=1 Tax=Xanthobacter autotrophicus (strain ATCC BAA-1158 / Py2) TaxID=78245 RepID=UPI0037266EED